MNRQSILFLSGILCDDALWRQQMDATEPFAHPLWAPIEGASVEEAASILLQTAPSTFAIVASSMGGYVALEMAIRAPERITSLVLSNTSARADSSEQRTRRLRSIAALEAGKFDTEITQLSSALVHPNNQNNEELKTSLLNMMKRVGHETAIRHQRIALGRRDRRAELAGIKIPSFVLTGNKDRVIPPEHCEEIASFLRGAQQSVISPAGHLPSLEAPDKFNQHLRRWFSPKP